MRRGQTLIEALVALTILMTGFVGITTLLVKSFELNRITSDDTQATYLASEGIEVTKSIIDHDVYGGIADGGSGATGWDASFSQSGYYNLEYDSTSTAGTYSSTAWNAPLYFNPSQGYYELTDNAGDVLTDFVRNIKVTNVALASSPGTPMIDVQCTVSWTNGIASNQVTLEDQFYDWQP